MKAGIGRVKLIIKSALFGDITKPSHEKLLTSQKTVARRLEMKLSIF